MRSNKETTFLDSPRQSYMISGMGVSLKNTDRPSKSD